MVFRVAPDSLPDSNREDVAQTRRRQPGPPQLPTKPDPVGRRPAAEAGHRPHPAAVRREGSRVRHQEEGQRRKAGKPLYSVALGHIEHRSGQSGSFRL